MTPGFAILLLSVLLLWWLAGSRSCAYLLYGLSFIPFVTLDSVEGGLQDAEGLGTDVVLFKVAVRTATALGIALLFLTRRSALASVCDRRFLPVPCFVLWAMLGLAGKPDPVLPLMRLGELTIFALLGVLLWSESARAPSVRSLLRWHACALVPLIVVTLWYSLTMPDLAVHVDENGQIGRAHV